MNELENRIYTAVFGTDKVDCIIQSFREALVKNVIEITHEGGVDFEYLCIQVLKEYIQDETALIMKKSIFSRLLEDW